MEEDERESIFTRLLGSYIFDKKKNKYIFDLKDDDSFTCDTINSIADASYDSTFKILFGTNGSEKRLSDFLNSILFPEDEDNIINLTYLNDEIHKIDTKHNKGMLRTDVACKIETSKGIHYVICIEMQITKDKTFTKTLFNYGTSLRNNNLYEKCIAIGISLNSEKGTNLTRLIRENDSKSTILKFIKIIEIDIRKELENMKNNIPVKINGKEIKNKGKEFLKLLGIRIWGKKDGKKYTVPNIILISSNDILKECFQILSSLNQDAISKMEQDEYFYMEMLNQREQKGIEIGEKKGIIIGEKNGIKIGLLKSAYILFSNGSEEQIALLFKNINAVKLNKDEVRDILQGNNEDVVEEFIKYLESRKYL